MKHAFNKTIHMIGIGFVLFGLLMMVRAAGMADLGGDFAELTRVALSGVVAAAGGIFVGWWTA